MNPAARKELIKDLINKGLIESQVDLVKALKKNGVVVTQTTASRDLLELGALRGRDSSGKTRYLLNEQPSSQPTSRSGSTRNLLLSATSSGNLVVAKTPPGGAQLLAGRIDNGISTGELTGAIGTIAGDDTVLVISKTPTGGAHLAKELTAFIDGEPLKSSTRSTQKVKSATSVQKRSK